MSDNTLSVSVVINAPVEHVWSLLIEQQQSDGQLMQMQKYIQSEPEGLPVAGQVIRVKRGPLRVTTSINQVVQADPPLDGQTISARVTFLGKEGENVSRWFRDAEHHHMQTQLKFDHPWWTITEQTDIWCLAMDETSCVIVSIEQSEMTVRLMPRWLTRLFDNDETERKVRTKAIGAYLQNIKDKAEQNSNQVRRV